MDKNIKAFAYAVLFLILAVVIGSALKPVILDEYFKHQESISVAEADPSRQLYGKVILINGTIAEVWGDSFSITDEYNYEYKMAVGSNLIVHITDRMNCKPAVTGERVSVAGAFNPLNDGNIYFYGVWVVGGCQ